MLVTRLACRPEGLWVVARHAERGLEVWLVMRGQLGSAASASLNLGLAEGGRP
jgi:hypothetical protein